MTSKYLVTTYHRNMPSLTGTFEFEVNSTDFGDGRGPVFYASAHPFGCSKNYRTAEKAILGMCGDHACSVTKIEELSQ